MLADELVIDLSTNTALKPVVGPDTRGPGPGTAAGSGKKRPGPKAGAVTHTEDRHVGPGARRNTGYGCPHSLPAKDELLRLVSTAGLVRSPVRSRDGMGRRSVQFKLVSLATMGMRSSKELVGGFSLLTRR